MNTFSLKMLALILMVVDHIGYYFVGLPEWLRLIGRISYPLFLFCMAWGYHYTKNRKLYLLRLYLMSLFMTALRYFVDKYFVTASGYGNHNIFVPLLLVGVLISTIEMFARDRKKGLLMLAAIFGVQLLYYALPPAIPFLRTLSGDLLTGIIPNLALNEYGFSFIVLGVLMYFLRDKKDLLCAVYVVFCISQYSMEMLQYGNVCQSFMILALPFILLYNKKKGPGLKYFFYFFYPAHTFLLFYLANFVF
ncbi:MAG: TraX family protein [Oscillospiraceae bacterium]